MNALKLGILTVVILILLYLFGTAIFAYLSNWLSP